MSKNPKTNRPAVAGKPAETLVPVPTPVVAQVNAALAAAPAPEAAPEPAPAAAPGPEAVPLPEAAPERPDPVEAVAPVALESSVPTPTPTADLVKASPFAGVDMLTAEEFARLVGAETPDQLRETLAHIRAQLAQGDFVIGGVIPSPATDAPLVGTPEPTAPVFPAAPVKVVALTPLAETIDGEVRHFAKGEKFLVSAGRAAALGSLVQVIGEAPAPVS